MEKDNQYTLLRPTVQGAFSNLLADLNTQLTSYLANEQHAGRQLQYTKVFLSDAQNQQPELEASALYASHLSQHALSIVEQPPLDGTKISLLVKTSGGEPSFLFHSFRLSNDEARGTSSYLQTMSLFEHYLHAIDGLGDVTMLHNLLRTWIYVADIDVNYAGVVKARNDVFAMRGLTTDTHFVASTGIGGYSGTRHATVAMDFLTYPGISDDDVLYLSAPDHLNATSEYGVAFERGTRLSLPGGLQRFFISGTASIDHHGEVLHRGDVLRQADRLLENIGALLAKGGATLKDAKYFIVYLRDLSDYTAIASYMARRFPHTPHILVQAKVCRPEWLIEMECIAEKA